MSLQTARTLRHVFCFTDFLLSGQQDIQQTNSAKFLIMREILDSHRREYKH